VKTAIHRRARGRRRARGEDEDLTSAAARFLGRGLESLIRHRWDNARTTKLETAPDISAANSFDQPIGEMTGLGGSVQQAGDNSVAAGTQGHPAGADTILVGPVALSSFRVARRRHQLTVRRLPDGDVVAVDTIDVARAGQRQRITAQVLEKLGLPEPEATALEAGLDQHLLQLAASSTTPATTCHAASPEAEFRAVEDAADPELNGLYATMPPAQICNFTMQIVEYVIIDDEDGQETRLRLVIRLRGRARSVEMTAADFASTGRLRTAIYGSALPGADLKGGADVLRRAVIALSDPAIRRMTTATGWTEDRTRFLVPGGHVDADGYHEDDPALDIPQVDRARCQSAQWLGLRRLPADQLLEVKRHVVDELRRLHEPRVMKALLGAAALAPLRAFAAPKSRPVIWLLGLTGSGKTPLASLFMNLFGDSPLDAGGRIATWNSTDNALQLLGHYHKDCLAVIDDFKPEMIRRADVVRLLQNAGDWTARGRLRHDARARATRPVRGLLLATAEDLPMQNASGLARSIIIEVPNREKDLDLGQKCVAMSPLYRGLMADFLAWVIREGRGAIFAQRVEHWQRDYYTSIRGRQNDARIAGNHALLAAAFEQLVTYLRDLWPESAGAAEEFATVDVARMVVASVGSAEEDQRSTVFLEALLALLNWGRVRLESPGGGAAGEKSRGAVVGRIVAGTSADGEGVVELSVAMALQVVQRSLRQQGKPPLQVSEKTLIAQLEAEGLLVGRDNRPIVPGRGGNHSRQVRIEGRRVRVIRMKLADLLGSDDEADDDMTRPGDS
jgi:hypothetical protein